MLVRFARTITAAAAFAAVLLPAAAHAAPAPALHRVTGQTITLPVREALTQIAVAGEDRSGYQRSAFKHWVDADRDGCDTRAEVLKSEAVIAPGQGPRCALSGGQWYSAYDDRYIQGPTGLDIDHLVPLAEAWDSGASTWSAAEREAYANDLGDDRALTAVSAGSNRSKADQDPTTWMPPAEGYRCQYATDWIADKLRWSLNLDEAEQVALKDILNRCSNVPVTVALAR
ncbi:HNH endonuclease family protein [Streptomyces longwoodensis]|uniref:HNH endonuclease family protein n=1 Tax=Streptomyces longwoodensis TaxID=68231 RepID=UPI00225473B7|nr:HNH endonuclease family protein [Streptomyces longwoodensis]MCX5000790.1 HNH endonuclease family protein [Streptomyces longwoodensis]